MGNAADRFDKAGGGDSYEFPGPYHYFGIVTDRIDPEGLGRVRVRIPGAMDGRQGTQAAQTGWLWPMGQSRSGSQDSGGPVVPAIKARVIISFIAGEIENGIYWTGPWSRGMVPAGNSVSGDGDQTTWETERVRVKLDSTGGTTQIRIEDKATGESSSMTLDMKTLQTAMHGATGAATRSRGAVVASGLSVSSNGRPVLPTPEYPRTALPADQQVPLSNPVVPAIPDPPARLGITMPGGLIITAIPQLVDGIQTEISSVQNLLSQAGPAMAAMQPIFTIIDAVLSIQGVLEAVPEIPVNPTGFFEALGEMVEKISKLAGLAPQVAVPAMVRDLIALVAQSLNALLDILEVISSLDEQAEAIIAEAVAAGNAPLEAVGQAVKLQAEQMTKHAGSSLGPVGDILRIAQALLDFLPGAPDLPGIDDLAGQELQVVIDTIRTLVKVLDALSF